MKGTTKAGKVPSLQRLGSIAWRLTRRGRGEKDAVPAARMAPPSRLRAAIPLSPVAIPVGYAANRGSPDHGKTGRLPPQAPPALAARRGHIPPLPDRAHGTNRDGSGCRGETPRLCTPGLFVPADWGRFYESSWELCAQPTATFGKCVIASSTISVGYSWSCSLPWWYCS